MRSRGLVMLLLAALAGLAAVVLAARWMQGQGGEKGQVAVAAADIPLGSRITPEMVRMVAWPAGSTPAGAFTEAAKVNDRVVLSAVYKGEPIVEGRLAPVGTKGGLSAVVPEGKRAMTVRVNDVVGVAGFALPGTFVDILVATQQDAAGGHAGNDKDRSVSKIVLERILVLAVAQEANRDETKPKVVSAVTLEVTPEQAEILDLARSVGQLSLVLRNQAENKTAATAGATKAMLLGLKEPVGAASAPAAAPAVRRVVVHRPAPKPAPKVAEAPQSKNCVEIIRGQQRRLECF